MTLIIAEKPALARSIVDALPGVAQKRSDGSIQKGDYIIIPAYGHLLTLKMPEDYDPSLKTWSLDTLPICFPNWGKKPNADTSKGTGSLERLQTIGNLLQDADSVIHAGDPDDEGQYLIDEILEYYNYNGPVERLATGNTAQTALAKALKNMDDNEEHISSGQAAYARSVADLIVGVNLSRYFTLKNPEVLLTIGRVQTPALGLVWLRDTLRETHKTIHYFTPVATVEVENQVFAAKYVPAKDDPMLEDGRILSTDYAMRKANMIQQMPLTDCTITVTEEKEQPPLPFNLDKLQLYCERKWNYSPQQTLDITQRLRDNYNAISYNRSDCQYLTSDQHREAPSVMACVTKNINFAPKGMDLNIKSRAFDDKYIEGSGSVAHLAIIPQAVTVDLNKLSTEERNVYLAICQYYMVQFMPPARKKKTKFSCPTPDGARLDAVSTVIIDPGYRTIFKDAPVLGSTPLSEVLAGTHPTLVKECSVEEGTTSPPPPYTQATLVMDMTRISKYVDDPEIKEMLLAKDKDSRDENGSIGTVATRAPIVEGLIAKGYVDEDAKGKLHISPLGKELCRILPEELVKPNLTARWWVMQENIKNGTIKPEDLISNVMNMVKNVLNTSYPPVNAAQIPERYHRKNGHKEVGKCPLCGASVVEGKKGFGCSAWKSGCKFVLWKDSKQPMLKNVKFSAADAEKLLAQKSVHKKNLCKKDGGTFEGDLLLEVNPESEYITNIKLDTSKFGSGENKEPVGACPRCGKPVVENGKAFSCSGYKDGCKFAIWKKSTQALFSDVTFNERDARALLMGRPVLKRGLKKKNGGSFDCYVKLDPNSAKEPYGPSLALDFSKQPKSKGKGKST